MVRTPSCDKNGLRKGTWTPEEDRKLVAYVTRYGCWNWRQLPKYAGLSRCGKSCRLRWMNYLRPNIKRGNYTKGEEETIIRLHEQLGNRWSAIAAKLPGRTDNEIKNHWHTSLKRRVKPNSVTQGVKQNHEFAQNHELNVKVDETKPDLNPNQSLETPQSNESSNSTLSPQPSSASDFSSLLTDTNNTGCAASPELISDDGFGFMEAYEALGGDFWTEPFLADNYYYQFLDGANAMSLWFV